MDQGPSRRQPERRRLSALSPADHRRRQVDGNIERRGSRALPSGLLRCVARRAGSGGAAGAGARAMKRLRLETPQSEASGPTPGRSHRPAIEAKATDPFRGRWDTPWPRAGGPPVRYDRQDISHQCDSRPATGRVWAIGERSQAARRAFARPRNYPKGFHDWALERRNAWFRRLQRRMHLLPPQGSVGGSL